MGQARPHRPVLRLLAAFSRHPAALDWSRRQAETAWGPVRLQSPFFPFTESRYYEPTMGTDLVKVFWAFERLADPAELPRWKLLANQWEEELAVQQVFPEIRPVNLDPGYITEAKLVLATTKDRDHRIYLSDGIYAECTLYYHAGRWCTRPWTYPDYARPEYHQFFEQCRRYLRECQRKAAGDG
ncbi:MAG: GTP-binding protein [Pirellulaceae bacterium]|nr:MAG: GTP-binding protein [Pirellulaceae bacterium]